MALVNLLDKISNNIDEKNCNIGIFIDLSKAFDTINHKVYRRSEIRVRCGGGTAPMIGFEPLFVCNGDG